MIKLRLTKQTQVDLDDIRELVAKKNYSEFRGDRNRLKLSEVYREVMAFSGFRVNGIDATCDSCLNDAVNIVYNFVMHHEQKPGDKTAKVIEIAGGKPIVIFNEEPPTITELGDSSKFPEEVLKLATNEGLKTITEIPAETETTDLSQMDAVYYSDMDYKDLLALSKEKGYKGGRIPKTELIDFLTKKGE